MLARVHSRVWARISAAMHGHSMRCRRLHSRTEGGEPRREHYAVHLAFSLINGGGAGRWMPALLHSPSRLCSSSLYFSLSSPLFLSVVLFFSPHFSLPPSLSRWNRLDFFQGGKNPVFDNRVNQLALFDTERKSKTGNSNYNFSRDPRSSYGYGKRDYTHTTREGAFLRVIGVVAAREKFFNHVCPIVDITLVTVSQD